MTFPKGLRLLLKVPLNPTPTNKTVDKITTLYKKKKKEREQQTGNVFIPWVYTPTS